MTPQAQATDRFVREVEIKLEGLLHTERTVQPAPGQDLFEAARHTSLARAAKRVRPRVVFLFGQAVEAPEGALLDVAVASELIHAASLVHDDVIDAGTLRRGRPTVNVVWDNVSAVLCGDLLFSISFSQLGRHPTKVMSSAVDVLKEMTCAAIEEVHARGNPALSLEAWRQIAWGKTGALLGWCGSAAALLAGDADAAARFDRCGRRLGLAFQIADDLKDLLTDDGKDRFADVKNRNPSFPLLWAVDRSPAVARALAELWQQPTITPLDAAHVGELIVGSGAVEAGAETLADEVERGLADLGPWRGRPGADAIEAWARSLLDVTQQRSRS